MISILNEIIDPNVCIGICGENFDEVIFKENSSQSKINKLTVKKIPSDCFVFTLDCDNKVNGKNYAQLSSYLNDTNNNGLNKSCDLVILHVKDAENMVEVSLIDLKSDKIKKSQCEGQLNNSELFIEYIFKVVKFYYHRAFNLKFRKVIIYTGPLRKVPVHRGKTEYVQPIRFISLQENRGSAEIFYRRILTG